MPLSIDTVAIVHTNAATMNVRVIDLPAQVTELPLTLSPDGSYLKAGSYWAQPGEIHYMLDLTNPDAEWMALAPGSNLGFGDIATD